MAPKGHQEDAKNLKAAKKEHAETIVNSIKNTTSWRLWASPCLRLGSFWTQKAFTQHFQNTIQNRTQNLIKNVIKMGAKTAKVWPKKVANRGQGEDMSPRGSEACPNSPQESPNRAPREPKERPKRAPREPQKGQKRPKRTTKGLQESLKDLICKPPRLQWPRRGSRSAYNY